MIMKKIFLSYYAPELNVYEVTAENGYGASSQLSDFGTVEDEFVH